MYARKCRETLIMRCQWPDSIAVADPTNFKKEMRSTSRYVDRIVPFGDALSFDYIWDGLNLFECPSKRIRN